VPAMNQRKAEEQVQAVLDDGIKEASKFRNLGGLTVILRMVISLAEVILWLIKQQEAPDRSDD
jgi:hypothetical protein